MTRHCVNEFAGLLLAAGLVLSSGVATADELDQKVFGDWQVGCDNIRHCAALSLPSETDETIAYLRLDRAAGPAAPVELTLRLHGAEKMTATPLQLALDGAPFPVGGKPVVGDDTETLSLTFRPAEVSGFVEAARKAKQLTVNTGDLKATVSLAGSVAAMLWIDEKQERLTTTSALIRKGSGTTVPAALAEPVVVAKPSSGTLSEEDGKAMTSALRAEIARRDGDLCEDDEMLVANDEAWPIDGERRLVALACSTGAYNLMSGFWLVKGKDVATAEPVSFSQGAEEPDNMLINAGFDPEIGRLDFFSKGRGIGDCGAIGSYAWTGEVFVQTEFSMMGECRLIGVEDWIILYRAVVK